MSIRWVIYCLLCWFGLPFVLTRDLWPAFRMGMFAEPVTQSIQTESWAVNLVRQSDTLVIPTRSLGFSEHGFIYLARNAYYQNQSDKLLLAIEKVCKDGHWLHGPNNKLEFIRIENGRSEVVATLSLDTAK